MMTNYEKIEKLINENELNVWFHNVLKNESYLYFLDELYQQFLQNCNSNLSKEDFSLLLQGYMATTKNTARCILSNPMQELMRIKFPEEYYKKSTDTMLSEALSALGLDGKTANKFSRTALICFFEKVFTAATTKCGDFRTNKAITFFVVDNEDCKKPFKEFLDNLFLEQVLENTGSELDNCKYHWLSYVDNHNLNKVIDHLLIHDYLNSINYTILTKEEFTEYYDEKLGNLEFGRPIITRICIDTDVKSLEQLCDTYKSNLNCQIFWRNFE